MHRTNCCDKASNWAGISTPKLPRDLSGIADVLRYIRTLAQRVNIPVV
jgi:hypothetical protein